LEIGAIYMKAEIRCSEFMMQAGEFRSSPLHDVEVGTHFPPSNQFISDFMHHFEMRYQMKSMGKGARIIAMSAAHHRLAYIHPFPDGNGRVSRLMSHAMGLQADIGASGLWSISRGLARGLQSRQEYKQKLAYADSKRINDYDGRGNLSEKALTDFIAWFIRVGIDQVQFMTELFEFDTLLNRLKNYIEIKQIKAESFYILERVLRYGEMPRGEAERVTGLKERSARAVLSALVSDGILTSQTPKSPVFLKFKSDTSDILFPRIFSES